MAVEFVGALQLQQVVAETGADLGALIVDEILESIFNGGFPCRENKFPQRETNPQPLETKIPHPENRGWGTLRVLVSRVRSERDVSTVFSEVTLPITQRAVELLKNKLRGKGAAATAVSRCVGILKNKPLAHQRFFVFERGAAKIQKALSGSTTSARHVLQKPCRDRVP